MVGVDLELAALDDREDEIQAGVDVVARQAMIDRSRREHDREKQQDARELHRRGFYRRGVRRADSPRGIA